MPTGRPVNQNDLKAVPGLRPEGGGSIRDTRMEHIGTGEVKRWTGWEHDAMLGFIKEAAAPAAPPLLLAAPGP